MTKILYIFIVCCAAVAVQAQEVRRQPDLQTADNTFFDPTRKETKKQEYHFGVEYRLEVGYTQPQQRTDNYTYPDMYLHGARIGATFTFLLPLHFSMQTGLLYSLSLGNNDQHWRSQTAATVQEEYIHHRVLQHNLTIPVRCFYTIPLWKELNMFFYAGPQLHIGMGEVDYLQLHLSEGTLQWLQNQGIPTEKYDRLRTDELFRANIQMGLGGGFEWDKYRLQAGYDFGLNNRVKNKTIAEQQMWEWGWYVAFGYRL